MRAAVLSSPGSVPAPGLRDDPAPTPGRSVVRVTAAPVVPLDVLCASGTSYFGRPATPYVPGVQGVGVVEQSGSVAVGSRVWFATSAGMAPGDGALAERCSVADDDLVAVGDDLDDAALAALGLSAVAAWTALTRRAALREGELVLVLGGGGAVGQSAVGVARAVGARRVVGVCRDAASADRARAAGADAVVTTGGLDPADLVDQLRDACGDPADVVLDPVFGAVATAAAAVLGDGGRLVNLGGSAGDAATFSSAGLRSRSISLLGYTNASLTVDQRAEALGEVARLAAQGRLGVAHVTSPLDDVAAAWTATAEGRAAPRHVLRP